jgi:branched-chain amino acid transport system ATP-binding protein
MRDGRFEVDGVTVRFGGLTALDGVSLHVAPGEVLGVIGPNGAGKTTLFNVVCGFLAPSEGELRWRGERLSRLKPHQLAGLGIARTLQGVGLFAGMSVLENVMTGATSTAKAGFLSAVLGLPRSDSDERALRARSMQVLTELGAEQYAGRYPGALPYPVQKRVALARALVAEPELLLLDEPAAGLGAAEMDELGDTIRALSDRMAVVLVEHHMDLVMRVCDRITVLDFGRVIADGPPEAIRTDPAVLAAYLGAEPGSAAETMAESMTDPAPHPDRPAARAPAPAPGSAPPSGTGTADVLEISDLVTAYGPVKALDGVSLTVPKGQITAVLGANGAGKTSLLRTVSGLVRSKSGTVLLDGRDITRKPVEDMVRLGMAHVPEGRGVIAELTVEENLRLGGLFRKDRDADARIEEVYAQFPALDTRRKRSAHTLSGGERQMLVVGRALLARPKVLLLDEPSLGLAPLVVNQIFGMVRDLVDRSGLAVLLVEQNAKSALRIADTGVVLNLGTVVATDSAAALSADDGLRHAYLGF